jgi:hypothetical protein
MTVIANQTARLGLEKFSKLPALSLFSPRNVRQSITLRIARVFAPARFGFSAQLATSSKRSISRKEIDSFDAGATTGVPP